MDDKSPGTRSRPSRKAIASNMSSDDEDCPEDIFRAPSTRDSEPQEELEKILCKDIRIKAPRESLISRAFQNFVSSTPHPVRKAKAFSCDVSSISSCSPSNKTILISSTDSQPGEGKKSTELKNEREKEEENRKSPRIRKVNVSEDKRTVPKPLPRRKLKLQQQNNMQSLDEISIDRDHHVTRRTRQSILKKTPAQRVSSKYSRRNSVTFKGLDDEEQIVQSGDKSKLFIQAQIHHQNVSVDDEHHGTSSLTRKKSKTDEMAAEPLETSQSPQICEKSQPDQMHHQHLSLDESHKIASPRLSIKKVKINNEVAAEPLKTSQMSQIGDKSQLNANKQATESEELPTNISTTKKTYVSHRKKVKIDNVLTEKCIQTSQSIQDSLKETKNNSAHQRESNQSFTRKSDSKTSVEQNTVTNRTRTSLNSKNVCDDLQESNEKRCQSESVKNNTEISKTVANTSVNKQNGSQRMTDEIDKINEGQGIQSSLDSHRIRDNLQATGYKTSQSESKKTGSRMVLNDKPVTEKDGCDKVVDKTDKINTEQGIQTSLRGHTSPDDLEGTTVKADQSSSPMKIGPNIYVTHVSVNKKNASDRNRGMIKSVRAEQAIQTSLNRQTVSDDLHETGKNSNQTKSPGIMNPASKLNKTNRSLGRLSSNSTFRQSPKRVLKVNDKTLKRESSESNNSSSKSCLHWLYRTLSSLDVHLSKDYDFSFDLTNKPKPWRFSVETDQASISMNGLTALPDPEDEVSDDDDDMFLKDIPIDTRIDLSEGEPTEPVNISRKSCRIVKKKVAEKPVRNVRNYSTAYRTWSRSTLNNESGFDDIGSVTACESSPGSCGGFKIPKRPTRSVIKVGSPVAEPRQSYNVDTASNVPNIPAASLTKALVPVTETRPSSNVNTGSSIPNIPATSLKKDPKLLVDVKGIKKNNSEPSALPEELAKNPKASKALEALLEIVSKPEDNGFMFYKRNKRRVTKNNVQEDMCKDNIVQGNDSLPRIHGIRNRTPRKATQNSSITLDDILDSLRKDHSSNRQPPESSGSQETESSTQNKLIHQNTTGSVVQDLHSSPENQGSGTANEKDQQGEPNMQITTNLSRLNDVNNISLDTPKSLRADRVKRRRLSSVLTSEASGDIDVPAAEELLRPSRVKSPVSAEPKSGETSSMETAVAPSHRTRNSIARTNLFTNNVEERARSPLEENSSKTPRKLVKEKVLQLDKTEGGGISNQGVQRKTSNLLTEPGDLPDCSMDLEPLAPSGVQEELVINNENEDRPSQNSPDVPDCSVVQEPIAPLQEELVVQNIPVPTKQSNVSEESVAGPSGRKAQSVGNRTGQPKNLFSTRATKVAITESNESQESASPCGNKAGAIRKRKGRTKKSNVTSSIAEKTISSPIQDGGLRRSNRTSKPRINHDVGVFQVSSMRAFKYLMKDIPKSLLPAELSSIKSSRKKSRISKKTMNFQDSDGGHDKENNLPGVSNTGLNSEDFSTISSSKLNNKKTKQSSFSKQSKNTKRITVLKRSKRKGEEDTTLVEATSSGTSQTGVDESGDVLNERSKNLNEGHFSQPAYVEEASAFVRYKKSQSSGCSSSTQLPKERNTKRKSTKTSKQSTNLVDESHSETLINQDINTNEKELDVWTDGHLAPLQPINVKDRSYMSKVLQADLGDFIEARDILQKSAELTSANDANAQSIGVTEQPKRLDKRKKRKSSQSQADVPVKRSHNKNTNRVIDDPETGSRFQTELEALRAENELQALEEEEEVSDSVLVTNCRCISFSTIAADLTKEYYGTPGPSGEPQTFDRLLRKDTSMPNTAMPGIELPKVREPLCYCQPKISDKIRMLSGGFQELTVVNRLDPKGFVPTQNNFTRTKCVRSANDTSMDYISILAGATKKPARINGRNQFFSVCDGYGSVTIHTSTSFIKRTDQFLVPAGVLYTIKNGSQTMPLTLGRLTFANYT